uniref:Uncharacterized protein n=1 Tax=Thermocrispum agreste TaxID=37925 RepID=A0A2W4JFK1_9PSEU|nr:MAG: hypothetical protein DIU77_15935 [Thermocrispum agreste]
MACLSAEQVNRHGDRIRAHSEQAGPSTSGVITVVNRELWVLYQHSPMYGAPTSPVGVLGIEETVEGVTTHVEWFAEQPSGIWPERLGKVDPQDLPFLLGIWQHDTVALAAPVPDVSVADDLTSAVRAQCTELLTAA